MIKNIFRNKKFVVLVLSFILLFVVFNLVVFAGIIEKTKNMPFSSARTYMLSAEKINELYIFPLSKFGLDNPFTWPFYKLRNTLYKKGVSLYPQGEGEGMIWWTNIYFDEYKKVVEERFIDYTIFSGKKRYFTGREKQLFHDWPKILYKNLKPLAFARVSDSEMRKDKYMRFLLVAHMALVTNSQIADQTHGNTGDHGPLTLTPEERKIFENIYHINEDYKKYAKDNEPDALSYVLNNPNNKSYDSIVKFYSANRIICSKFRRKELTCDDPFITVFAQNHKELLNYMQSYPENSRYIRSLTAYYPDQVDIVTKCQANPVLKDHINFIEKGMGMSINSKILKGDK